MAIGRPGNGQGQAGKAVLLFLCALLVGAPCAFSQAQMKTNLKKILVLKKSQSGINGHSESRADFTKALEELATEKGFTVTTLGQTDSASKINAEFSAASLATYQAVIFCYNDGVSAQLDAASKTNVEVFVRNGGGLVPIHSASDFISNWSWLTSALVESYYGPHGMDQPTANVSHDSEGTKDETETQGIFKGLTAPQAFLDEFYSFRASPRGRPGVTILLTVDEKSYSKPVQGPMGVDHPVAWTKTEGKGRVAHISLGHSWSTNNVYAAKNGYLKYFLYGALRYVAGDFVGCTDITYAEYNPDATKSDPTLCKVPTHVLVRFNRDSKQSLSPMVSQDESGTLVNVEFFAAGSHEVSIKDITGKQVYLKTGSGRARFSVPTPEKSGIYIVKAKAGNKVSTHRVTVL